jgi:hypothetical protein
MRQGRRHDRGLKAQSETRESNRDELGEVPVRWTPAPDRSSDYDREKLQERVAKLVDVMAMQASHTPLDYSLWDEEKSGYIAAIHAGHAGDYAPMQGYVARAWRGPGE